MTPQKFVTAAALIAVSVASGCSFVSSSTTIKQRSPLQTELVSRSGATQGPNSLDGSSFTDSVVWAALGNGSATLGTSELTIRHSSNAQTGMSVFASNDSYSVEGLRDNSTFSGNLLQDQSFLGRYTETSGSGSDQIAYVGYSAAGFHTPFADLVSIARAGSTVRYTGVAALELIDANGHNDGAQGSTDISIDFGANRMAGDLTFSDPLEGGTGHDLSAVTLNVESGSLVGNTFSGVLTGDLAQLGASSLSTINMQGGIFGAQAAEIGGSFNAIGTAAGTGNDVVILGGFLGSN